MKNKDLGDIVEYIDVMKHFALMGNIHNCYVLLPTLVRMITAYENGIKKDKRK